MTSTPGGPHSFRDELDAYLKWYSAQGFIDRLCPRVLKRWRNHGECERIWKVLGPKLECPAEEFITRVLQDRATAEEIATRIKQMPAVKAETRKLVRKYANSGTHWNYLRLRDLAGAQAECNEIFSRMLGRKAQLAPRMRFIDTWSDRLEELCGKPLDRVVAALTEIAFGQPCDQETVRKRRKNRNIRPPK